MRGRRVEEHYHYESRDRTTNRGCSGSAAFISRWLVVCVAALPALSVGQEDGDERTESGKERGPNSQLAKKAEV